MNRYFIRLEVHVEGGRDMALQLLGSAIKQKFKKQRGEGIRKPEDFEEESGVRWK